MKYKSYIIFLLFLLFLEKNSAAQNSKNVSISFSSLALLDIAPAGSININFTAPTEAGNPLINPSNNTKWINYSSAVTVAQTRSVTASISASIPGVDVKIQAAAFTGAGGGARGITTGLKTLSTSPNVIINGIGGAFTGNGANNGHQLTISLVPNNYTLLAAQNTNVTITYTIISN